MVQDYAKNQAQPPKQNLVAPLIIICIILISLGLLFLKVHRTLHSKKTEAPQAPAQNRTGTEVVSSNNTSTTYEFYTLLPKIEVQTPTNTTTNQNPAVPSSTGGANNNSSIALPTPTATDTKALSHYALQVASFQNLQQAQRFLSHLAEFGFSGFIQTVVMSQGQWFRVYLGPYSSLDIAQYNQKRLQQDNFQSLLVKAKPQTE